MGIQEKIQVDKLKVLLLCVKSCLPAAAQLLGNRWRGDLDKKNIDCLLNGISTADFQINVSLFQLVQSFYFAIKSLLLVAFFFFFFFHSFAFFMCRCVRSRRAFVF